MSDEKIVAQELEVKVVLLAPVLDIPHHINGVEVVKLVVGSLLWVGPDIQNGFFPIVEPVDYVGKWIYIGMLAPTGKTRESTSVQL